MKFALETYEQQALPDFVEKAYLNYSMYVILDRALPQLADGLKPVQRRILYAMSELGLRAGNKPKKAARTIGDVIGKYHPHGDSACYEAMVLMAQPFSYRQPLVDGQGNWGSSDDPKSFAAMRYTEARLTAYAQNLLEELDLGTVTWQANFDGTLQEPQLLPARLPNILLNGSTGIAVGMATDIPPHNVCEVVNACLAILENPEINIAELRTHLPAPDFPTSAEIISSNQDLQKLYETGNGSVRQRAIWRRDEDGNIVIDALPWQVSGNKIMEAIAAQMRAKKLPMLEDLRDESDHENPTRLVLVPRSARLDDAALMAHLFASTDLERSYRVNLNMIGLNGKPQVKNLKQILAEWLDFRRQTVTRRCQHKLAQVEQRLHLLDGFLIAYLNIDEIIKIIRTEKNPKKIIIEKFGCSELQAEAILNLKLRQLMRIEEFEIVKEQKKLNQEQKALKKLLENPSAMSALIGEELRADAAQYGDARRAPWSPNAINPSQSTPRTAPKILLENEAITVLLSKQGWIRAAKSHDVIADNLSYKSGDGAFLETKGRSAHNLFFFDQRGRSYSMAMTGLPSARTQGEPLSGRLNFPTDTQILQMRAAPPESEQNILFAGSLGYGFIGNLNEATTRQKAGKQILNLNQDLGELALNPLWLDSNSSHVLLVINNQKLLILELTKLPKLGKGRGSKLVNLSDGELITDWQLLNSNQDLLLKININNKNNINNFDEKILSVKEWQSYVAERAKAPRAVPKSWGKIGV